jgi:DNA-binding MarR family transcriptional regulator
MLIQKAPAAHPLEDVLDLYSDLCAAMLTGQQDAWLFIDLTMPQIKALYLMVIWGSATSTALAKAFAVGLPSVTRLVDRLVERGLVLREEDPRDRRVTHMTPTADGRRVIEDLVSYKREYLSAALQNLSQGDLEQIKCGLTHLVAACQTMSRETLEPDKRG